MRPDEIGSCFQELVREAGGDPEAPSMSEGLDAFRSVLGRPLDGLTGGPETYADALLFEVSRFPSESPDEADEIIVGLVRRPYHGEGSAEPEILRIEWRFQDVPGLSSEQIMGSGRAEPPAEPGVMRLEDFLAALDSSPAVETLAGLKPTRVRVTIDSYD